MVSELLTEADEEFQQGNFEHSSKLYILALEKCDESDCRELAAVLQKLADSDYAREEYELARQSYERLVTLHQDETFSAKEKVSALLKCAKTLNKCGSLDEAQIKYQAAYDLANESLPSGHFLTRTVKDGYAEWLLEHNRNPELLQALHQELGIELPAKEEEIVERRPEEIVVPTAAPKHSAEKEVFVLRTKLTRKSKKEDAEEKAALELKAKKLTIEQEVAERKFLRKKDEKDKGDQLSNRRSRLRSSLAKDHGSGSGAEDSNATDQVLSPTGNNVAAIAGSATQMAAAREANALSNQRELETLYPAISEMMEQPPDPTSNQSLSRLSGKKPQRSLRTKKTGIDLVIKENSAPISEVSKTFLQQAEAVKKASEEEEVAPDVVALRSNEKIDAKPMSHQIGHSMKFLPPVLGLIMLIGLAIFWIQNTKHNTDSNQLPLFVLNLQNHSFTTADGSISINFTGAQASISADGHRRKIKPRLWRDSVLDEISLIQGDLKNSRWLTLVPAGLKDESGTTFYSEEAPERRVIVFMKQVADEAQQYYVQKSRFPTIPSDLTQNSYSNPFTNKASALSISSFVDNKNTDANKEAPLDLDLQSGTLFKKEEPLTAGVVHACSVSGRPHYLSDQNEYDWEVQSYYVHGADRDGKLIAGTGNNKVFLICLKNGAFKPAEDKSAVTAYSGTQICLCENEVPDRQGIILKYMAILALVVLAAGYMVLQKFMPAIMANAAVDRDKKFVIPD